MRTILLSVLIIIFCSCGRTDTNQANDTSTIKVIDVISSPDSEIINLSEIALDIEYIPLQTSKNILIEGIFEIITCANKIYVNTLTNVICFDIKGQFLYDLSRGELGPGEYLDIIYDFDISSDDNTLVVLLIDRILEFNNTGNGYTKQDGLP